MREHNRPRFNGIYACAVAVWVRRYTPITSKQLRLILTPSTVAPYTLRHCVGSSERFYPGPIGRRCIFTSKRRDRLAGLSLGLAIALKATPAILIVPFIVNKRWRALFYCCLGALAAHLPLMLYPNGLATIQSFLSTVGEIAAGQVVKDPFYDYSLRHFAPFFIDAPATLFWCFHSLS